MALLTWTTQLELGFPQIDKQHQQLVNLMNELHEAARAGRAKDVVGKILASLVSYTKTHFAEEEALMVKCGYPGYAAHRAEHTKLTGQVLDAQKRFLAGTDATMTIELMEFLCKWLVNHIQGSDRQYAVHIAKKPSAGMRPNF